MALDPKFIGRSYGPFVYEAGLEKMREFAYAVGGGVPSSGFSGRGAPAGLHPAYFDPAQASAGPWQSVIAMPTFCVTFAIVPFARACLDPELQINLVNLVHGDQRFDFDQVVRPGDVLTTVGHISNIEARRSLDFLEVTTETTNQREERVVRGVWTAIIRN